jgi:hypothetical protein
MRPKWCTVPRLGGSSSNPAAKASEDAFLAAITEPDYQEAMGQLFASVKALALVRAWGSKGASIHLKSPDQAEPISIGWVFLEGDQWTWAKHVIFGVDPNTLKNHPSVAAAILDFCEKLKGIPGGQPASGKSNARIFAPPAFVAVRDQLIDLLSELAASDDGSVSTSTSA